MGSQKNVQDVLRGLIEFVPVLAFLLIALFALAGIACCGYALVGAYRSNVMGEPFTVKWFAAFASGFAMIILAVVTARFSILFGD